MSARACAAAAVARLHLAQLVAAVAGHSPAVVAGLADHQAVAAQRHTGRAALRPVAGHLRAAQEVFRAAHEAALHLAATAAAVARVLNHGRAPMSTRNAGERQIFWVF